jgi:23S rRNA (adenine2503-C2)-methyltransferase
MDFKKLQLELENLGEPKFRFSQIYRAIFIDLIDSFDQITTLPKDLRKKLALKFLVSSVSSEKVQKLKDQKVEKVLFKLSDGNKIESVLISEGPRNTVCVSSQVGCAFACKFCATGLLGFKRNLLAQEIYDQVLHFARLLKKKNKKITNIVFMGMGEPFLNYDEVMRAIRVLNDKDGFNLGQRHFSISTVGIIPGIKKFIKEGGEVNLAVSLHAADNKLRSKLLPINKKYPIEKLISVCRDYVNRARRKIFFEYVMLKDVNDLRLQAQKLASLLSHPLFHVNLIRYNLTGTQFFPSLDKTIFNFQKELQKNRIHCTVRKSAGGDIWAACGQLGRKI